VYGLASPRFVSGPFLQRFQESCKAISDTVARKLGTASSAALKGRNSTAQGNALGNRATRRRQALKGRNKRCPSARHFALSGLRSWASTATQGVALGSPIVPLRGIVRCMVFARPQDTPFRCYTANGQVCPLECRLQQVFSARKAALQQAGSPACSIESLISYGKAYCSGLADRRQAPGTGRRGSACECSAGDSARGRCRISTTFPGCIALARQAFLIDPMGSLPGPPV